MGNFIMKGGIGRDPEMSVLCRVSQVDKAIDPNLAAAATGGAEFRFDEIDTKQVIGRV